MLDTGSSVFKGGHAIIHRMIEAITDAGRRPVTITREEVMTTLYLLQQNVSADTQAWQATAVYPSTFRRRG